MKKIIAIATIGFVSIASLAGCSTQTQTDINALLGSSASSEALSYVVSLDPTVATYANQGDAFIVKNAPAVLSVACGGLSMAHMLADTTATIDPKLINAATIGRIDAGFVAMDKLCPPNAPPANIADAAHEAMQLYADMRAAITGAGVKL